MGNRFGKITIQRSKQPSKKRCVGEGNQYIELPEHIIQFFLFCFQQQ